jgi:hypothetical protein
MDKRTEILEAIKPICEAFGITEYDYVINYKRGIERLIVNGIEIGCSCNSVSAVIDELIGYIFIKIYCRNRSLGAFETQVKNQIKRYWISLTERAYE